MKRGMGSLNWCPRGSTKRVPDPQHQCGHVCVCSSNLCAYCMLWGCCKCGLHALFVFLLVCVCRCAFLKKKCIHPLNHIWQLTDIQTDRRMLQQSQHLPSVSGAKNKLHCCQYENQVATFCGRAEWGLVGTHWKCSQHKIKSTLKKKPWLIKTTAWTWSERCAQKDKSAGKQRSAHRS